MKFQKPYSAILMIIFIAALSSPSLAGGNMPNASVSPSAPDGKNGWYVSRVKIAAPSGYLIADNQDADDSAWMPALNTSDGVYESVTYYLKDKSSGIVSQAKQAPGYKQDTTAPTTCSDLTKAEGINPPGLMITAKDNMQLSKIVVLNQNKPVYTFSVRDKNLKKYTIIFPFTSPGVYNAMSYDMAGNYSTRTIRVTVEDRDGDGLCDEWEAVLHTDPDQKDTDGDGIDDRTSLMTGAVPGGRLTAAATLLLNKPGTKAGAGLPDAFLNSELISNVLDIRAEDVKKAPALNGSTVILQFNEKDGEGWALNGSRLMHFIPSGGLFVPDTVMLLQGSFGALRLVLLPSADGSKMLLASWNTAAKKTEGPLKLLDTVSGKIMSLKDSENADAFDLIGDGTLAAYSAGGRIHVINLQTATEDILNKRAGALTFTPEGRLAVGTAGERTVFYKGKGKTVTEAYSGFLDTVQRTNTTRSIMIQTKGETLLADASGMLAFSPDGKKIVYSGINGTADVVSAEEYEEIPQT